MNDNIKKKMIGEYPVNVLFDRIIDSFYFNSPLTEARLDDLYNRGLIRRGIFFNPDSVALRTPTVNLLTKEIEIQQVHIAFLWCQCYNFVLLNEVSQRLANKNSKIIQIKDADENTKVLMDNLTGWSFSLRDAYSFWPPDIPDPACPGDNIRMANELLVQVVKFLLYHEIAHLGNNHANYLQLIATPNSELSDNELSELKMLEIEADNYAFEMSVGPNLDAGTYNQALGALVALLSNLFIITSTRQLKQLRHPDIDTRIFNLMNKIKFEDIRYQMNIDQTLNAALSFFLHCHKINFIPENPDEIDWHETFEEVLRYLYDRIDDEK